MTTLRAGRVLGLMEGAYTLLLSMLVGAQCAVGYLVAPILFAVLPERALAGTVAGAVFERLGWCALVALFALLTLRLYLDRGNRRQAPAWVHTALAAMMALTAVGHLWIRPWIASVRVQIQRSGGFELCDPALRSRFGALHGLSSVLFLCVTLIGIALVLRLRDRAASD
jgi:hypothetical protein